MEVIQNCTKDNVFAIADYYGLEVSRQVKKQVLVRDVCSQLMAKGVLPAAKVTTELSPQSLGESVRHNELEELKRLAIK